MPASDDEHELRSGFIRAGSLLLAADIAAVATVHARS